MRAAGKERIIESSRWWKQGFEGGPFEVAVDSLPQPDLTIPISKVRSLVLWHDYYHILIALKTSNNTLGVQTCAVDGDLRPLWGSTAHAKWLSTFAPPITDRLNRLLPGANLTDVDTVNLMSLCGFDTAAKNGMPSPWCDVFTTDEWKSNEYYYDMEVSPAIACPVLATFTYNSRNITLGHMDPSTALLKALAGQTSS